MSEPSKNKSAFRLGFARFAKKFYAGASKLLKGIGKSLLSWTSFLGLSMLLFGATVGGFVGFCSSPIATTFIPLMFTFLASGGMLFSFFSKKDGASVTLDDRRKRAAFIAIQGSAFTLGILPGFWLGAYAKVRPDFLWPASPSAQEYAKFPHDNYEALMECRNLEIILMRDGLDAEKRYSILERLHKRKTTCLGLSGSLPFEVTPAKQEKKNASTSETPNAAVEAAPIPDNRQHPSPGLTYDSAKTLQLTNPSGTLLVQGTSKVDSRLVLDGLEALVTTLTTQLEFKMEIDAGKPESEKMMVNIERLKESLEALKSAVGDSQKVLEPFKE